MALGPVRKFILVKILLVFLSMRSGAAAAGSKSPASTESIDDDIYDFYPFPELDGFESTTQKPIGNLFQSIRFFWITNPNSPNKTEIKIGKPKTLSPAKWNKSKPLKVLIHGFMSNCAEEIFPGTLVNAYFEGKDELDVNLICVDWAELSHFGGALSPRLYQVSMEYSLVVGQRLAQFIKFLRDRNVTGDLKEMHLIGYSLGAHVAGNAGYHLRKHFNETIGRITGLDPAGPYYGPRQAESKLDRSDARFVDVYHTNAGRLGIESDTGHVDFYVNGGSKQPQCQNTGDPKVDLYEAYAGFCSHQAAPKYYARSILNPGIKGCKCESWAAYQDKSCGCHETTIFGEHTKPGMEGRFYLSTHGNSAIHNIS